MRRRRLRLLTAFILLLALTVLVAGRREDISKRPDLRPPLQRGNPTIPHRLRGQFALLGGESHQIAATDSASI